MRERNTSGRAGLRLAVFSVLLMVSACRQDMHDQPRYEPLESSSFFRDGRAARPLIEGTVAQGDMIEIDPHLTTGKVAGKPATTFPIEVTSDVMSRGKERYEIYCTPCHGQVGDGRGMIAQRGFKTPPSFHEERLRKAAPGYFVDVMTQGFGVMYSYATRVAPRDRWAIAAYIRALQLSQGATLDDLPTAERSKLEGQP